MIDTLRSEKLWLVLGVFVGVAVTCQGQDGKPRLSIEIAEFQRRVWCGDPMGLELKLTFAEPKLSPWTGASRNMVKLAAMELFKGHGGKALSLIDELGTKYPHGELGQRAKAVRAEFESLINEGLKSSGNPKS